jgi:sialidase-1
MIPLPRLVSALLIASVLATASAENEVALDLEPSPQTPRNSEGAFVTLRSGRVLFLYTQFRGGAADESPARLAAVHSDDEGRTWSEPRVVLENEAGRNVMSVSLLRLAGGRIALFYLRKNSWLDCRPVVRFSEDEAETWSEATPVGEAPGYFVLNNDRVVQLRTGRLVVPLAFHRSRGAAPESARSFDPRALAIWLLSDDEGRTWREAGNWWALPVATGTGMQEPGVVELANGELLSWARTDQGSQFATRSTNGGVNWPPPAASDLRSPVSPASIKRLPGSDALLAVWNDHSGAFDFPKGKRTPLIAGISTDGGVSWGRRKAIETDPGGWYCYTAIHFAGDAALLAYCAGDAKVGGLNRLRIRRVSLAWLLAPGGG